MVEIGTGKRQNPYDIRVVVTGLGTINPIGNNVAEFWENLVVGKSGIRTMRYTEVGDYPVKIAGEIDIPDLTAYFKEKRMIRRLDRYVLFGHVAGTQALRDAGLDTERDPTRYGSLIGTGDGGVGAYLENIERIVTTGMHSVSPFYLINAIPSTATGFFAQNWNLQGPCFSVNSACATSNHTIGLAAMLIKWGMADAIIAGGAEAPVNKNGVAAFGKIQALSERNDSPETASRPFDKDRDGFILSEGAGALCLEELSHAKKRGAKIYAEIKGFAFSCDAHDLVAPHPESRGAVNAMRNALTDAGLAPADIGLINAHATSTTIGDRAESIAIEKVFGKEIERVLVHSTKSMTGHSLGATSAIEAIAAILAFEKNVIHYTTNQFEQDPDIKLHIIKKEPLEKKVDHILSNAFGFGGQNAALVLSRFTD
ncbi:MAG TPA: beta-ketoacyl-[acyl-carrier-protein] synthase family protein [Spirochaetia bacterium]|nr:beta-ketoacyl-[acyl-carrier-protein] synthase family protein [Spirochaetia bacterium]